MRLSRPSQNTKDTWLSMKRTKRAGHSRCLRAEKERSRAAEIDELAAKDAEQVERLKELETGSPTRKKR